jgi:hypothetical protein
MAIAMSIELKRAPTTEEVEQMCAAAEEAARKCLLSSVSFKDLTDLDVTVEAVGDKPLTLSIEVAIEIANSTRNLDSVVDEATNHAFLAAEAKARELRLCEDTLA